jgi:hypothetical protein
VVISCKHLMKLGGLKMREIYWLAERPSVSQEGIMPVLLITMCEISASHGGEYEDCSLLGRVTV